MEFYLGPSSTIPPFMKLRSSIFLAASLAFTGASAQQPGPPVIADGNAPKIVYSYSLDVACANDIIFMLYPPNWPSEITLSSFAPDGKLITRSINLPVSAKNHYQVNAFTAIGNNPCVVYDEWDKKTGIVSIFAQRYAPNDLAEVGKPVALGTIPLDEKTYRGDQLMMSTRQSPDGKNTLLIFDKIQQGGIKLAMCWVLDNNLNTVWSGAYKIPVQAYGSSNNYWLMNDGRVYAESYAIVLDEDDVKETKEGSTKLKRTENPYKHRVSSWYELHGKSFQKWERKQDEDKRFAVEPLQVGERVFFAGVYDHDGDPKTIQQWVLYDAGANDFDPQLVATGDLKGERDRSAESAAIVDDQGNIFVSLGVKDGMSMVKLNAHGIVAWNRVLPWRNSNFIAQGEHLLSYSWMTAAEEKAVLAGKVVRPATDLAGYSNAMMLVVNSDGAFHPIKLLPENSSIKEVYGYWRLFEDCGCMLYRSGKKDAKGIARVNAWQQQ